MTTLVEIAKRAGVSKSTASNVVRGHSFVAEATRQRVERAIAELGYHPNAIARSLKSRTSSVLGIVVPDLANPFYAELVVSVERAANALRFAVLALNTECLAESENDAGRAFIERRVEGVIIGGISVGSPLPKKLLDHDIPVVLASLGEPDDERLGVIDHDDAAAMEAAVDHLHALGHRRFTFAAQRLSEQSGERRNLGFERALARRRLAPVEFDAATAIIAHNDVHAIAVIDQLEQSGLRVPEDVSVIGHDDIPIASHSRIRLTTIRSDAVQMGRRAVDLLVGAARTGKRVGHRELQDNPLIVRSTTARARP
ncbi:MAG: LacI family DNA-binding transcriptional regulator [Aestuariivirgaceae bacterium]